MTPLIQNRAKRKSDVISASPLIFSDVILMSTLTQVCRKRQYALKIVSKIFFKISCSWEQCKLGDLVTFSKGSGYSKGDLKEEGTPIILYGRLYTKYETVISDVANILSLNWDFNHQAKDHTIFLWQFQIQKTRLKCNLTQVWFYPFTFYFIMFCSLTTIINLSIKTTEPSLCPQGAAFLLSSYLKP